METLAFVANEIAKEKNPRTCNNDGSKRGYANSSEEWQCDNCGYSESN